jgi:hypothetical protein
MQKMMSIWNSSRGKETRKMRKFRQNKEDEKVPTEQYRGNKRKNHGDRSPEEKILSEQNRERKKVEGGRWDGSRWIDPFCNPVDELIILN